ncbi:hypothetical protein RhoFasGS6_03904 [Rhodococcus fascians]|uniref:phage tail fiber protein n=1 Tax=Rhodococcoides fascians TaxID=1828 RepID=UPI001427C01C|nr:hypothetical protein [Rhodococcus fascians]
MAIAVTTTKNSLASAYAALGAYVSLHTASPAATGANEATGGSPAYARKQTTWGAASGSTISGSEVTFDVPAGTYTHWGLWTAATGGTFIDGGALSASVTLSAQGQVKAPITYTQS